MSGLEGARRQGLPYLERFLRAGGGRYVDMYDFHQHLGGDTLSGVEDNTRLYRETLAKYGEASKAFEFGAIGVPSEFRPLSSQIVRWKAKGWKPVDYAPIDPRRQAELLVASMVFGRSQGAERVFWTRTRDHAPSSGPAYEDWIRKRKGKTKEWVVQSGAARTRGIIGYDYVRKPSFMAFKVLIERLDHAEVFRNVRSKEGVCGVIFKDNTRFTGVFFSWEGKHDVTLRSSAKQVRTYDIYGKEQRGPVVKDGRFSLRVTPEPIYLEGDLSDLTVLK
jgi:hypothetical protein